MRDFFYKQWKLKERTTWLDDDLNFMFRFYHCLKFSPLVVVFVRLTTGLTVLEDLVTWAFVFVFDDHRFKGCGHILLEYIV